ncbi:hypothetical protein D6850_14610 [Roseovarius spongiae]|uniref:Recombinase zinc beta ribbon domain-containing protein n=1 Tax=Roseovarius spongiae TaxID=2320272 RepID=A0A3A8AUK4_9RHOB|nr:hypothetical protein D6850_14610 [Roseovarius spongiae]
MSRPAAVDDIVYGEAPDLAILDDDVWNKVQDRLERTHALYAGKTAPLNGSHRARYLLNGLLKCGCCGGGFTLVAKERYGCYIRKTQGTQECGNSRTITRERVEDRVLARLRHGLITPAFAGQFAAEVKMLLARDPKEDDARRIALEGRLKRIEAAIERLLDRLESEEAGESLLARLASREAERDELRAEISKSAASTESTKLPTAAELEKVYRHQVERIEDLLTGCDHMVEANTLLKALLGEVRLSPDKDAQHGMAIEIRGEASRIWLNDRPKTTKGLQKEALSILSQISVVAGVGFEPTTFRL